MRRCARSFFHPCFRRARARKYRLDIQTLGDPRQARSATSLSWTTARGRVPLPLNSQLSTFNLFPRPGVEGGVPAQLSAQCQLHLGAPAFDFRPREVFMRICELLLCCRTARRPQSARVWKFRRASRPRQRTRTCGNRASPDQSRSRWRRWP